MATIVTRGVSRESVAISNKKYKSTVFMSGEEEEALLGKTEGEIERERELYMYASQDINFISA